MVDEREFDELLSLAERKLASLKTYIDTAEFRRALGHALSSLATEMGLDVAGVRRRSVCDAPIRVETNEQLATVLATITSAELIVGPTVTDLSKLTTLASTGRVTAFFCFGSRNDAADFLADRLGSIPVFATETASKAEQLSREMAVSPVAVILSALNGKTVLRHILVSRQ